MPELIIEDEPREVEIVVGPTPTTGPFTIPFSFFQDADVKVSVDDGVSVVVKTITTDYTVTGVAVDGGFDGGTLDFVSNISNVTIKIFSQIIIDRTNNFPTSGPFKINLLNLEFNKIIAILQEQFAQAGRFITLAVSSISSDPWDFDSRSTLNVGESSADSAAATNRQVDASGPNFLVDDNLETAVGAGGVWRNMILDANTIIEGASSSTAKTFDLMTEFFCILQNRNANEASFRIRYRFLVDCYSEVTKDSNVSFTIKIAGNSAIPFHFMDIEQDIDYINAELGTVQVAIDIYPLGVDSDNMYMQWRNLAINTSEPR